MARRTTTRSAFAALLVVSVAMLGGIAGARPNASPHFITGQDTLYATMDSSNGTLFYFWKVAGLGNGGSGFIRLSGVANVDVQCEKKNGDLYNDRRSLLRINEHDIYADRYGNATAPTGGDAVTRPNAICNKGGTPRSGGTITWTNLKLEVFPSTNHSTPYDTEYVSGGFTFTF